MNSMTGFGRGAVATDAGQMTVEIRTVNGRGLDVKVRGRDLPAAWEAGLTARCRAAFRRGNVAVTVSWQGVEEDGAAGTGEPDLLPLRQAHQALQALQSELNLPGTLDIAAVCAAASLFTRRSGGQTLAALELDAIGPAVDAALQGVLNTRAAEGAALLKDVKARFAGLRAMVTDLAARAAGQPAHIATRMRERLHTLLAQIGPLAAPIDAGRIEQDIALLCERADVSEELVRLHTHLDQVDALLAQPGAPPAPAPEVGRKLEFWIQEISRELNTLTVKMQDSDASRVVVDAKAELEKIREQAQNIE